LSPLKRIVSEYTVVAPPRKARTHEIQSNSAKTENDRPVLSIMIAHVMRSDHYKYQETTESLNFFILRIAIVPPADRNGLIISKV